MIEGIPYDTCCGCEVCRQICPVHCIEMKEDEEGFLYPKVTGTCIQCGKCLLTCPVYTV